MDRDLALRLIHPWRVGSQVEEGITLDAVSVHLNDRDHRKDCILIEFSSGFRVRIFRRTGGASAFETRHFSVTIVSSDSLISDADRALSDGLKLRLSANEEGEGTHAIDASIADSMGTVEAPNLWVLPGHLGNSLDLSIRTLRVLQTVDLLLIETGSASAVAQLYAQYSLGAVPVLHEIRADRQWLQGVLREARSNQQTTGIFGANEGAPGLCDPGWRVMEAAGGIEPPLTVRTVSGGSALTTALLYANSPVHRFTFLGTFENDRGLSPFLRALRWLNPWTGSRSFICFADGLTLRRRWKGLHRALGGLEGSMTLISNVSLGAESTIQLRLGAVPDAPMACLNDGDKVVVRIDVSGARTAAAWVWRALLLPWAFRE